MALKEGKALGLFAVVVKNSGVQELGGQGMQRGMST